LQVNATTGYGQPAHTAAAPVKSLDKDAFLLLFVEQLKNQNPMSPQDSSEFMAQMAQFSMLEQLTNINESILQARLSQSMGGAAALLGKEATVRTVDGEISGCVEKITIVGHDVLVVIEGKGYGLDQVSELRPGDGWPNQKEANNND